MLISGDFAFFWVTQRRHTGPKIIYLLWRSETPNITVHRAKRSWACHLRHANAKRRQKLRVSLLSVTCTNFWVKIKTREWSVAEEMPILSKLVQFWVLHQPIKKSASDRVIPNQGQHPPKIATTKEILETFHIWPLKLWSKFKFKNPVELYTFNQPQLITKK